MKMLFNLVALILLLAIPVHGEDEIKKGIEFKRFLDGVRLHDVFFDKDDDITFLMAISLAISKAIELDASAVEPRSGISRFVEDKSKHIKDCVVFPGGLEETVIVYHGRDVSLHELLLEIARQSNLDLYASSAGLVFCRPNKEPTKEFPDENFTIWTTLYQVKSEAKQPKQGF